MITTHVLDTARGRPASGVGVRLEVRDATGSWRPVGEGVTDTDGRLRTLMSADATLLAGSYRLIFDVEKYFKSQGVAAFYERVTIEFLASAGESHYHVPMLLSPYGYSTYRGT